MEISERIDYLVRELCHDNGKVFAERLGIQESSVSKWRHGAREPRYATLEKILSEYPEVRREWLIDGKGKPFLGRRVIKRTSDAKIAERLAALEKKMDEVLAELAKFR